MSQSIYETPNPYQTAPVQELKPASTESLVPRAATELTHPRVELALRATRPWAMMFGVILLLFSGLISIFFFAAVFATFAGGVAGAQTVTNIVGLVLIGGLVLIYFCPAMHLIRYSGRIGKYLNSPTHSKLADALESQHKFWRFVGVTTVIVFFFQVLAIVAAVILPMMATGR
jgi:hypothetical protein